LPTAILIFLPLGSTLPPAMVMSILSAPGSVSVGDGVLLGVGDALADGSVADGLGAALLLLAAEADGVAATSDAGVHPERASKVPITPSAAAASRVLAGTSTIIVFLSVAGQ
jgi:hypothetical protein